MKEEDQVIAIAEFRGWINIGWQPRNCFDEATDKALGNDKDWYRLASENTVCMQCELPDYLNDLHAMHEAVRSLPDEQKLYYMKHLFYVLIKQKGDAGVSDFDKHLASASVCAEAFLKTIGKWTDNK